MATFGEFIKALTLVKRGDKITDVASSERINAIIHALLFLLKGENIKAGPGLRKASTLGQVRLNVKRRSGAHGDPHRQWQLRTTTAEEEGVSGEIHSGSITGMGLSGFPFSWVANEWNLLEEMSGVWLKFEFTPLSEARLYATSEDSTENLYVIIGGEGATVELICADPATEFEDVNPQINVATGVPTQNGIYHIMIGSFPEGASPINDFLGPLAVAFCAPATLVLYELTSRRG